jgi:toxin ParE1/3/4
MNGYTLSEAADADLQHILTESSTQWGFGRAERYILDLHQALESLAAFPNIGRDIGHIRQGYFWFRHASHGIFYQKTNAGVFIVRVLHQRQVPENYL